MALDLVDVSPHVVPTIVFDGKELSEENKSRLVQTVVDTHLHLPDMFEITFEDSANSILQGVHIGSEVEIYGGAPSNTMAEKLIIGEVTSIEGDYEDSVMRTVVRGYDKSHRLQRVCRTRTFVDMTDADIAKKIALDAKFPPKDIEIEDSRTTHKHTSQVAQTDWDFLVYRAREIGYEMGVAGGKFYFRKASKAAGAGAGGLGGAMSSLPSLPGTGGATLTFKKNLIAFWPRLSSSGLVTDVEIRVWDPESAAVVVGSAPVKTVTAKLPDDPAKLAQKFPANSLPLPQPPKIPGLPDFGVAPNPSARVVVDRPLHRGSSLQTAVDEAAAGLAEHIGSTFAEAEGIAYGDAAIQPGKAITIAEVPEEFNGSWVVTNARHTFVPDEGGYRTRFVVSGRHDRSLLSLSGAHDVDRARTINGLVPAVVTNNNDPDKMGRVKVAFPWLAPNYESDWARVAQYGMGKKWGGLFLPEVGDEVLVGFEFGDVRRPYVLGGVINGKTEHDLVKDAVKQTPPLTQVTKRGFVSRLGNRIVFQDEDQGPVPTKSSITIGDKDEKVQIVVDKKNGEIKILCDSTTPPSKIVIQQTGKGGSISINADGNISLEATAPGKVSIKGGAGVAIDGGAGPVEVKGSVIKLN